MASEIAMKLMLLALAATVALVLVLLLRLPLRKWLGPGLAYTIWALVPAVLCAAMLPTRLAPVIVLNASKTTDNLRAFEHAITPAPDQSWPLILIAIWLVGAALLGLYFQRQHRAFMIRLGRLTDKHGIHYAESAACGPALIGLWHPRIIVPADFDKRYGVEEQKLIVAHERTHLQRADAGTNLLCALLQCLFWFHPLFHIASRAFRFDQELACDAAVMLQHPHSRKIYADAMLKTQLVASGTPAGCSWQFNHPLKERVMSLSRHSPNLFNRIAGSLLIALIAGGSSYAAWAGQAAQMPLAGGKTYRLALDLQDRYGRTTPALEVREGEEATLAHGEGDERMSFSFIVNSAKAGAVKLNLVARVGEIIVSEPKLLLGLGQAGTFEVRDEHKGEGNFLLKLSVTDVTPGDSDKQGIKP